MRAVFVSIYIWLMVGVVTFVSFLIFVPLAVLAMPFDRNRQVMHWGACCWAWLLFTLNPLWRLNIQGREKIDRNRAYILAINHQSMGDIIVLYALGIHFKWISKKSMFYVPLIGWAMYFADYIPLVRGDTESIKRCIREAKAFLLRGVSIMMFPEGSRSHDGKVHAFKDGAFRLSVETGMPVIPIALDGTGSTIPKGSWLFSATSRIHVVVGDPIRPPVQTADSRAAAREVEAMRETARRWIIEEVARIRGSRTQEIDSPTPARPGLIAARARAVGDRMR